MKLIFESWRRYINEITTLADDNLFLQTIADSAFWLEPHTESDVDEGTIESDSGTTLTTPAIEKLMTALNHAANSIDSELYFILTVNSNPDYVIHPDDPYGGYPTNWMMHGQYTGPQAGKHVIWLQFRPVHDGYDTSALDSEELVKIISRTINHEIVHYSQLKKQASSKGLSDDEAWEELMCDPEQVPISNPEEYRERCGREAPSYGAGREIYLSRHIEVDAYAHEAAEQLLDKYSPETAIDAIRNMSPVNLDKYPEISLIVKDYAEVLKDEPEELNKFRKKLYQQVQRHIGDL